MPLDDVLLNPDDAANGLTPTTPGPVIHSAIARVLNSSLDHIAKTSALANIRRATEKNKTDFKENVKIVKDIIKDQLKPWSSRFITYENGEPKPIMANGVLVLEEALGCDGVLWLNEFTGTIWVRRVPPWSRADNVGEPCDREWSDADESQCVYWMQQVGGFHANKHVIFEAVDYVSKRNKFHPVRDYFDGLVWDRKPGLDTWVIDFVDCADTEYHRAVSARWVIGLVARIYQPGCKSDCALIIEGEQGIGKSTAFKVLAGADWFTDQIEDIRSKDTPLKLRGKLIIELAELDALTRADVSRIKVFMSTTTDRFRPPYGRLIIEYLRQCGFAGTVNENQYLKDPTGGRRFWPIASNNKPVNIVGLQDARDQLWAEAVARYRARQPWHLETPELVVLAKAEQEARYAEDPRQEIIAEWLDKHNKNEIATHELIQDALDIHDKTKWKSVEQDIGKMMKRLGWERRRIGPRVSRAWKYFRPGHEPSEHEP